MKKLVFLPLLLLPIIIFSQRKPKIKGSRTVTEVREELPPFTRIELKDDLEIELKKSYATGYEIVADDNLIDVLKFEVMDSTLVISSFYTITGKKKLDIAVNVQELQTVIVKAGKITSGSRLESDQLQINAYGNAKLDLNVSGFFTKVNAEDNSKINLSADVDSLSVSLKQKAVASIYATTTATAIDLEDTSSLAIEGATDNLTVETIGNTKLTADELEAGIVDVSTRESGFIRVNAFKSFTLKSSGNSKTHLHGTPKITIEEFHDASQLLKKGD